MAYDENLAERIRTELKCRHGLTEKKMFGGVGFLINGNMACGVIKQDMVLRLDAAEFETALKRPHVRVFDMSGRPMKGWVYVAPAGLTTGRQLQAWVEKGAACAEALPKK